MCVSAGVSKGWIFGPLSLRRKAGQLGDRPSIASVAHTHSGVRVVLGAASWWALYRTPLAAEREAMADALAEQR